MAKESISNPRATKNIIPTPHTLRSVATPADPSIYQRRRTPYFTRIWWMTSLRTVSRRSFTDNPKQTGSGISHKEE
ncbi:hypothetical protein A0H81_07293 [Grifola frondosa]|uniref:Uncharacterized protein n=1 Tax=Grifola frondosa TaxID=5627 RepID=A0A1C7MAP5_GRIFR|nr:hypothetical protein A0H81_07293 [Grifola frondosa]